jgi:hypothetical protein
MYIPDRSSQEVFSSSIGKGRAPNWPNRSLDRSLLILGLFDAFNRLCATSGVLALACV